MTDATLRSCISFSIGGDAYAIDAADVREIHRRPRITRVPGAPDGLLGLAALRGAVTPVVSLARLLGGVDAPGPQARLILLSGGATLGPAIGLAVDRVGALSRLAAPETANETPPGAAPGVAHDAGGEDVARLFAVEEGAVRRLDLGALLREAFAIGTAFRRGATPTALPIDTAVEAAAAEEDGIALLSFVLAGQTYALPLEEIDEVLALPERLAAIAASDTAAIGVLDFRGRLLPVVALRRLLGLPEAATPEAWIVAVRIGDALVGLAVDRLQAVLRVPRWAIDLAPAALNQGPGEARVDSIGRLPGGQGLVAILSARRIFSDAKVGHVLAQGRRAVRETDGPTIQDRGDPWLVFRLGRDDFGLPLAAVDEIVRLPERLTRIPGAPAFVRGVLNLRGKVIPVIDQRNHLQIEPATGAERPRVIVATLDGRQAGFIVDSVPGILALTDDQLEATPELTADAGRLFSRVATLEGGERMILLIDPRELLDRTERDLLAGMDAGAATRP